MEEDANGRWKAKKVNFNQLDKNIQKGIEGIAKTDAGKEFFGLFAKKGDKIGSVEFDKDGDYSDYDYQITQFSIYGSDLANEKYFTDNNKLVFRTKLNKSREYETPEAYAITMGHEMFIHQVQYFKRLIKAYEEKDFRELGKIRSERDKIGSDRNGGPEHDGYLNRNKQFRNMYIFESQLKNVLNPVEVNKMIQDNDKRIKDQN